MLTPEALKGSIGVLEEAPQGLGLLAGLAFERGGRNSSGRHQQG